MKILIIDYWMRCGRNNKVDDRGTVSVSSTDFARIGNY